MYPLTVMHLRKRRQTGRCMPGVYGEEQFLSRPISICFVTLPCSEIF